MYRTLHEVVHEGRDGWVQYKGNQEEEPEHAHDTEGAEEQGSKVLYILQSTLRLLTVRSHVVICFRHN